MHKHRLGQAVEDATREAQNCQSICVETIQHCLHAGGSHAEPSHMRLMQDCADICETTALFHLRGSPQHGHVTAACVTICDLCAASCEKFTGDAQMQACADECRLCAAACRRLLPETAGGVGQGFRGVR